MSKKPSSECRFCAHTGCSSRNPQVSVFGPVTPSQAEQMAAVQAAMRSSKEDISQDLPVKAASKD